MAKAQYIPVVRAGILNPDGTPARFSLSLFGLPYSHFMQSPGGGYEIREALRTKGLEGYTSSPFLIDEVHEGWLRS